MSYPDIGKTVATMLRDNSAISTLVGSRIYNGHVPQSAPVDGIVFWIVSELPYMAIDGALGMDQARFQFDAFGQTQATANEIAWTIWTETGGFSGVVSEVHIKGLTRSSGVAYRTNRVKAGTDQYRFIASQDLIITYCSRQRVIA